MCGLIKIIKYQINKQLYSSLGSERAYNFVLAVVQAVLLTGTSSGVSGLVHGVHVS